MTSREKKIELSKMRLNQSGESLKEAHLLFQNEMSLRGVVNRAYYTMFYSVLALFVFEPYSSSKHSGVLSYFHKKFIKEGVFSKNLGDSFKKAFKMRNSGDYKEFIEFQKEEVETLLKSTRIFIDEIRNYLTKTYGI